MTPYIVVAHYDKGKCKRHFAWTFSDALDWMRQYPASDKVIVKRHGLTSKPSVVAMR